MKNIYTTIAGALTIIAGVCLMFIGRAETGVALLPVGVGLILAKDFNTSGIGSEAYKSTDN